MEETNRKTFLEPRMPSIDRRYRPHPNPEVKRIDFDNISESDEGSDICEISESTQSENDKIDFCGTSESSLESTTEYSNNSQLETAEVYLRLRPLKNSETACASYKVFGNTFITIPFNETNSSKNNLEKHFVFTDIFDENFYQSDVYRNCVEERILLEQNFTIMTYGTSGSGKTFTLLGGVDCPGIVPRSIEHVFTLYAKRIAKTPTVSIKSGEIICLNDNEINECVLKRKILLGNNFNDIKQQYDRVKCKVFADHKFSENENEETNFFVSIWVSFVEIYNENCYDLLHTAPGTSLKRDSLKIYSNNSNVYIKNLTSVFVKDSLEAYKLLTLGLKRLNYAATAVNLNSSRSHCIFIIDCLKSYKNCEVIRTTYKYCDLAGSERLGKTQNLGNRLKEAQCINTSLMVLGRCLDISYQNQIKRNQDIIPFRDSKLTMILKAPLLGKEKIALLVNISPTEEYYEENLNVLSFSSIAKKIKIIAKKPEKLKQRFSILSNFVNPQDDNYAEVIEENIMLRNEVERLQKELVKAEMARSKVVSEMKDDYIANTQKLKQAAAKQEELLTSYYETKLQIKTEYYDRQQEDYERLITKLRKKIGSQTKYQNTVHIIEDDDDEDEEDDEDAEDGEANEDINNISNRSLKTENDLTNKNESMNNNLIDEKKNLNITNATDSDTEYNSSADNSDAAVQQNESHQRNSTDNFENRHIKDNLKVEKNISNNNIDNLNKAKLEKKNRISLNYDNLEKEDINSKKRRLTASPTF